MPLTCTGRLRLTWKRTARPLGSVQPMRAPASTKPGCAASLVRSAARSASASTPHTTSRSVGSGSVPDGSPGVSLCATTTRQPFNDSKTSSVALSDTSFSPQSSKKRRQVARSALP